MADVARSDSGKTHFVLVPLVSPGHLIPMTDLALALAKLGQLVTIFTTPANATRLRPTVDLSDHPIDLVSSPLPTASLRIPPGCENLDSLPPGDDGEGLLAAVQLVAQPLKQHIQSHPASVGTVLVSDFGCAWTRQVAAELGIPWYLFYSVCFFSLHCLRTLPAFMASEGLSPGDSFAIPGIPHRVEITGEKAQGWFRGPDVEEKRRGLRAVEDTANGVVVNSFAELEPEYAELYLREMGMPVWAVGPLGLHNTAPAVRGGATAVDVRWLEAWLDSRAERSVVYVCFGSLTRVSAAQRVEIELGLEATGRPFVWAERTAEAAAGLVARPEGRGVVVRGWAPQAVVLGHRSVGAFVTHCGWNSVVEGLAAGVPMVTWPWFGDQFLNERLVVDVAGTGVAVGAKAPQWWSSEGGELVTREEVAAAVERVMCGGWEAEERRARAEELGRKAVGTTGSSAESLRGFVESAARAAGNRCRRSRGEG